MLRALNLFFAVAILLIGTSFSGSQASTKLDSTGPALMGTNKLIVIPGDTVTFTVTLTGVANGNEVFTVTAPSGSFINLPSTITPQVGATSVTFTGTVGFSLLSGIQVSVSDDEVTIPAPTLFWFLTPPSEWLGL